MIIVPRKTGGFFLVLKSFQKNLLQSFSINHFLLPLPSQKIGCLFVAVLFMGSSFQKVYCD